MNISDVKARILDEKLYLDKDIISFLIRIALHLMKEFLMRGSGSTLYLSVLVVTSPFFSLQSSLC